MRYANWNGTDVHRYQGCHKITIACMSWGCYTGYKSFLALWWNRSMSVPRGASVLPKPIYSQPYSTIFYTIWSRGIYEFAGKIRKEFT